MVRPNPRVRFTVDDYMSTPEGTRYQLLDGEMILAPSPTGRHQKILLELSIVLHPFITGRALGDLWTSPFDVVFEGQDVAQPDILFVSNERADIVTPENVQGAPDLCVERLLLLPLPNTTGAINWHCTAGTGSVNIGSWTRRRTRWKSTGKVRSG